MPDNQAPSRASRVGRYPQIAARVFGTPLLIDEAKLATILGVLGPRLEFEVPLGEIAHLNLQTPEQHMLAPAAADRAEFNDAGFWVVDGTAMIPVLGTLVQRSSFMDSMSGMQGYGDVLNMLNAALEDNSVRDIIFEIDSPGGEVHGAFDLADSIFNARGMKPMTAVASEVALSAAYLIASAADEVVTPRTGQLGSIGVVMAHFDHSKQLAKKGVAATFIYAGDKKVDGNKFQPLPASVKAELQAEVDSLYELFTQTVARNRGLNAEHVRNTEAGVFMGFKAVEAGLADRVNTLRNELHNQAIRQNGMFRLQSERNAAMSKTGKGGTDHSAADNKHTDEAGNKSSDKPSEQTTRTNEHPTKPANTPVADPTKPSAFPEPGTPGPGSDPKDPTKPAPENTEDKSTGQPGGGGYTGKGADERTRIKAITTHAEAEGRSKLANHLAFDTELSVDAAVAVLQNSPREAAAKGGRLAEAMKGNQPGISSTAGVEQETVESQAALNANSVYAARKQNVSDFNAKQLGRTRLH